MQPDPPDDAPPAGHVRPGPPPAAPTPPLLDYPSITPPDEPETERWSDIVRAAVFVFGLLGVLFFGVFGLCGLLGRGCS